MFKFKEGSVFIWLFWGLYYCLVFLLLLNNSYSYLDPDFGWHLKVGEEISRQQEVPRANLYNYSLTENWVDHEWLSDWGLYQIYEAGGYIAVSVVFSGLITLVMVILHYEAKKRFSDISPAVIVVFQLLGLIASLPHLGVRLQSLGLLLIVCLLALVKAYDQKHDWRLLLWLPPLFYLWASLHASFLLGLFLLFAWLAVRGIEAISARFKVYWVSSGQAPLTSRSLILFLIAAFSSVVATSLTPYRLEIYTFLSGYRDSFYQTHIVEWLPQHFFPVQYLEIFYMSLVVGTMIVYFMSHGSWRKVDRWEMFLIVLFLALGWQARRHFPLLVVATMPFIVFYSQSIISDGQSLSSWRLPYWLKAFIILCLVLSSVSVWLQTRITNDPFSAFCDKYPCQATEFLASRDDLDNLRLFNNYGWGGYLIWQLPSRQLFIDGRLPQAAFAGHTFLEEYLKFFKQQEDVSLRLDKYDIRLVLIPAQDDRLRVRWWEELLFGINTLDTISPNYLRKYLEEAGWPIIYSDGVAIIYARP